MNNFVVVIPIHNDYESLDILIKEIAALNKNKFAGKTIKELIISDDGSIERNIPTTNQVNKKHWHGIRYTLLDSNIKTGSQAAILRGLDYVSINYPNLPALVMDGDGEDQPGDIVNLIEKIENEASTVLAIRGERHVSKLFRVSLFFFKKVFRVLTGKEIKTGNFMAIGAKSILDVLALNSSKKHISMSIIRNFSKVEYLILDRGKRYRGVSRMNYTSLSLHAYGALSVFADVALIRIFIFASSTSMSLFLISGIIAFLKISGTVLFLQGWTSIILLGMLQLALILLLQAVFAILILLKVDK